MAEARIVQHADRSPSGCVACGTQRGPFLDFDLTIFKLATATGLVDIDGSLYVCVGTEQQPGCLVQWARKSGLMVDTAILTDIQRTVENLEVENGELRALLSKKTLTLADAQMLYEGLLARVQPV